MGVIVGPVMRCADGYRFETWTASKGVTRGYSYHQIEDALYARNSEIRTSARGGASAAIACRRLDEFVARTTGCETRHAA